MPAGPQATDADGLGLEGSDSVVGDAVGSIFKRGNAASVSSDYLPSGARRNVGTGVAVQEPPAPLPYEFERFGLGDVSSLYRNLLGREASPEELASHQGFGPTIEPEEIDTFLRGTQGGDLPTAQSALDYFRRTNNQAGTQAILNASASGGPLTRDILALIRPEAETRIQNALTDYGQRLQNQRDMLPSPERQQQLASYGPGSLESMLATGYSQLFGRDIDPAGAKYFLDRFGGQNLDQAAVNRMLLGGAQGADREAAQDYQLSLTGGRPDYEARMAQGLSPQYFQPIYRSSYQDYAPTTQAQPRSVFSAGFNPFDYTSAPSAQRLGEIRSALAPYLTAAPAAGPTAGFDAYTGYNPFTSGAVNPYAARMARPTAQPTLPGPEQPAVQSPTVQQNITNPFVRSVGEGVAVDFGPSTLRQPAPTSFPYLSSYLRAYAKGGGVGIE